MPVAEKPVLHPWEREVRYGGRSPIVHKSKES